MILVFCAVHTDPLQKVSWWEKWKPNETNEQHLKTQGTEWLNPQETGEKKKKQTKRETQTKTRALGARLGTAKLLASVEGLKLWFHKSGLALASSFVRGRAPEWMGQKHNRTFRFTTKMVQTPQTCKVRKLWEFTKSGLDGRIGGLEVGWLPIYSL